MKILITSDLHYDVSRSRPSAVKITETISHAGGDALVLVGDSAGADLKLLDECLGLFDKFTGRKFFVPGNHCLWCAGGETSMDRYDRLLPQVAAGRGFVMLDHNPQVIGGTGLVGSVGWYDYSFRDESLGIPLPFYHAKVSPGAAEYLGDYAELLAAHKAELTDRQMSMGARWMDGWRVKLGMSDEAFVEYLAGRMTSQLADLAPRVGRIIAFIHHLPFVQLVPRARPAMFAFAAAYMGSPRFGEVLLACPKVSHLYCGHSHWPGRLKVGHIEAVVVASTYTDKHLEVLEIEG